MLKEENFTEREPDVTLDDLLLLEQFRESMTDALIEGMGEEVLYYMEKDLNACMTLFVGGALYGEENADLKRVEIVGRGKEFRAMARYLIENLQYPSLKNFETHEELYTQFLIQGIYFGQKNARLDS